MAIELPEGAAKAGHRADGARSALPSAVRIGFSRVVPEIKMFYRRPEQLALTFSMPAVICLLLGSIFTTKLPGTDTSTGAVIAASMLAYGILSTSFVNLGIGIAADRETGALRRLRGTPGDRVVVLHREDHAGRHREPRRGRRPPVGGRCWSSDLRLPTAPHSAGSR